MRCVLPLISSCLVASTLLACTSHDQPAAPPTAAPAAATPAGAQPPAANERAVQAPAEVARVGRAAIAEADARAVLEAWLSAQNQGDFAAYSALYAARFSGVKRSEDRVRTYAHDGWLDNRQRMFRRPQHVSASDVMLRAGPSTVDIHFTQSWSSASYSDEGPKRLLLVRDGEALRIAREEMLASTRTDSPSDASHGASPSALRFMMPDMPGQVELATVSAQQADAWSAGRPALLPTRGGMLAVAKQVVRGALPAPLRAMVGNSFRVYGGGAQRCEAAIVSLQIVRRYTPHFGQVQGWNTDGTPAAERAAEAWETGADGGVLTGSLARGATCRGGDIALPTDAPVLTLMGARHLAATDPMRVRMEQVARTRSEYVAIEREFQAEGGQGPWQESEGAVADALAFGDAHASVGTLGWRVGEGCGGFSGALMLPFAAHGLGERVTAMPITPAMANLSPLFALDVDADGTLELLARDRLTGDTFLLRAGPHGYGIAAQQDIPYFDCPC